MKSRMIAVCVAMPLIALSPAPAALPNNDGVQDPEFLSDDVLVYRGELYYRGEPIEGVVDLEFRLFPGESDPQQIGPTILAEQWELQEGRVLIGLDFGDPSLREAGAWLEITVDDTIFSPRQYVPPSGFLLVNGELVSEEIAALELDLANSLEDGAEQTDKHAQEDADRLDVGAETATGTARRTGANRSTRLASSSSTVSQSDRGDRASADDDRTQLDQDEADQEIRTLSGGQTWEAIGTHMVWTSRRVGIGINRPAFKLDVRARHTNRVMRVLNVSDAGNARGLFSQTKSTTGRAIEGLASAQEGVNTGVWGQTKSSEGRGVFGYASATGGETYGVYGSARSPDGRAVCGINESESGVAYGGFFRSTSAEGWAVYGEASATSGSTSYGGYFISRSNNGRGVYGEHWAQSGTGAGGRFMSQSPTGRGVLAVAAATSGTNYGVYGVSNSDAGFDFFAGGRGANYGSSSSLRWKRNIREIDEPLYKLAQLRGVYYDWDAEHGGHHDVGMIAEEVGNVLPEIVQYEENGIDAIGMDYSKLTPLLVEAVNALRAEKDTQIVALQKENKELRERLAQLEAIVAQARHPQ